MSIQNYYWWQFGCIAVSEGKKCRKVLKEEKLLKKKKEKKMILMLMEDL